jgi:hypothetical protein
METSASFEACTAPSSYPTPNGKGEQRLSERRPRAKMYKLHTGDIVTRWRAVSASV